MSTLTLLQSLILIHLVGLLLFAGTTIVDFITIKQFWRQYDQDKVKAAIVLQVTNNFQLLMRAGIGIIVLSGIGMMAMTHGIFGEQLWFRIKFALVLLVIANNLLVGRRQRIHLRKSMETENGINIIGRIRNNLRWFYGIQLFLFFIIILLSVFKFS